MTRNDRDGPRLRSARPRRTSSVKPGAPKPGPESDIDAADTRQRIAKTIARAGLCSRRDAEAWILDGRVSLNGTILTSPAVDVSDGDVILVDGDPLPRADKTRLFLFHKPKGLITSDHDPEGRATIFDHLREHWPDGPRVVTIGRLDINTEGLLLLTNDGGLARVLELPSTGWVRRYRVRAKGTTDQAVLDRLGDGLEIDGVDYAGIEAKLDRIQGANCWLTMGLREGKNREIKRVLEHIGLDVNRLIRLSFGPFQLLDLPEGAVEEVKTRILRDQLGPVLAAEAGADFSEPEPVAPIVAAPLREPARFRGDRPVRAPDKAAPRGRNFRDRDRMEEPAAPPAVRERPVSGPRKHVSALRAETGTAPRKRLERSETADRKNRKVTVERLITPERPARAVFSRPGRHDRKEAPSPFRRERPDQPPRREPTGNPARRERSDQPARRERPDQPARRERQDQLAPRERYDQPARRERYDQPARRERLDASFKKPFAKEERGVSQSALAKRERIARSGGGPEEPQKRNRADRSFSANRAARADERVTRPRALGAKPAASGADRRLSERPSGRAATGRAPDRDTRAGRDKRFDSKPHSKSGAPGRNRPPPGKRGEQKPGSRTDRPRTTGSRKPGSGPARPPRKPRA